MQWRARIITLVVIAGLIALFTALRPLWTPADLPATAPPDPAACRKGFDLMSQAPPKLDDAAALFTRALADGSCDAGARFGLGWVAQLRGQDAEAQSRYAEVLAAVQKAKDVELEYFTQHNLGALHLAHKRFEAALTAFNASAAVAAANEAQLGERLWADYDDLGRALTGLNRDAEALVAYDAAKRRKPSDAHLRLDRAAALRKLGKTDDARAELDEAVKLDPSVAGEAAALR